MDVKEFEGRTRISGGVREEWSMLSNGQKKDDGD